MISTSNLDVLNRINSFVETWAKKIREAQNFSLLIKEISAELRKSQNISSISAQEPILTNQLMMALLEKLIFSSEDKFNQFALEFCFYENSLFLKSNVELVLESILSRYQAFGEELALHNAGQNAKKIKLINYLNTVLEREAKSSKNLKINYDRFFAAAAEDFNLASQANISNDFYARWLLFLTSSPRGNALNSSTDAAIADFFLQRKTKQKDCKDLIKELEDLIKRLNTRSVPGMAGSIILIAVFLDQFSDQIKNKDSLKNQIKNIFTCYILPAISSNLFYPYYLASYVDWVGIQLNILASEVKVENFWAKKQSNSENIFKDILNALECWGKVLRQNIPSLAKWRDARAEWRVLASDKELTEKLKEFWKRENKTSDYVSAIFELYFCCQDQLDARPSEIKGKALQKLAFMCLQYLSAVLHSSELLESGVNPEIFAIQKNRNAKFNHSFQPYLVKYMDRALMTIYRRVIARIIGLEENKIKLSDKDVRKIEECLRVHNKNYIADISLILKGCLPNTYHVSVAKNIKEILIWNGLTPNDYYFIVLEEIKQSMEIGELLKITDVKKFVEDVLFRNLLNIFSRSGFIRITNCDLGMMARLQPLLETPGLHNALSEDNYCFILMKRLFDEKNIVVTQEEIDRLNADIMSSVNFAKTKMEFLEKSAFMYDTEKCSLANFDLNQSQWLKPIELFPFHGELVCLESNDDGIEFAEFSKHNRQFRSHKKEGWALATVLNNRIFVSSHEKGLNIQRISHASATSMAQIAGEIQLSAQKHNLSIKWTGYTGHFVDSPENLLTLFLNIFNRHSLRFSSFAVYVIDSVSERKFKDELIPAFIENKSNFRAEKFQEVVEKKIGKELSENKQNKILNFLNKNFFDDRDAFDTFLRELIDKCREYLAVMREDTQEVVEKDVMLALIREEKATRHQYLLTEAEVVMIHQEDEDGKDKILNVSEAFIERFKKRIYFVSYYLSLKDGPFYNLLEAMVLKKQGKEELQQKIMQMFADKNPKAFNADDKMHTVEFFRYLSNKLQNNFASIYEKNLHMLSYLFCETLDTAIEYKFSNFYDFLNTLLSCQRDLIDNLNNLTTVLSDIYSRFYKTQPVAFALIRDFKEQLGTLYSELGDQVKSNFGSVNANIPYFYRLVQNVFSALEAKYSRNKKQAPLLFGILLHAKKLIAEGSSLLEKLVLLPDYVINYKNEFLQKYANIAARIKAIDPKLTIASIENVWSYSALHEAINHLRQIISVAPISRNPVKVSEINNLLLELERNPLLLPPYPDDEAEHLRHYIFSELYSCGLEERNNNPVYRPLLALLQENESHTYATLIERLAEIVQFKIKRKDGDNNLIEADVDIKEYYKKRLAGEIIGFKFIELLPHSPNILTLRQ